MKNQTTLFCNRFEKYSLDMLYNYEIFSSQAHNKAENYDLINKPTLF